MNSFVEQCGPGSNPLMSYVGTFTGNKSNWQDQFHASEGPQGQRGQLSHSQQQHRRQEKQMMKEYFNPQEFQRFGEPDQMTLRDSGRTAGPNQLNPVIPERPFQNFVGGFKENALPITNGPSFYNVTVSSDQKDRISSRSHVLSKHLSEDAEFAENQVDGLLSSLNIDHSPHHCAPQSYNHSIESRHADWINDYSITVSNNKPQTASKWSNSFLENENYFVNRTVPSKPWAEDFQKQSNKPAWANEFTEDQKTWAEDFNKREGVVDIEEIKELRDQILNNADEKLNSSKFMNFYNAYADGEIQKNENGEFISTTGEGNNMINDFLAQQPRGGFANEFIQQQQPGNAWADDFSQKSRGAEPKSWVDDFHKEKSYAEEFNEDDEEAIEREWQSKWEKIRNNTGDWAENYLNWHGEGTERDMIDAYEREFNKFGDPDVYVFQTENPFLSDPQALEKGIDFFDQGRLNECILALEATVQQDPTNTDAWTQLGKAHAENDKDKLAILALEQAVAVDHGNLDALMALAVSLTNEYEPDKTGEALKHWLLENPKYSHLLEKIKPTPHETVTQCTQKLFLEAVRQEPSIDPDVHIALGLLYNLSFEYEKATQCFKVALVQRPDDYALWNKYGATIANSPEGRSSVDVAIEAYFHALEKKPSFTRARSNLGISYMSAKNYVESAKCFLGALTINNSPHLWDSARSSFLQMGRTDLAEKCNLADVRLFRNEFDF
jgi:cytochrome c-type biogenesis protein CcmH/NrfG